MTQLVAAAHPTTPRADVARWLTDRSYPGQSFDRHQLAEHRGATTVSVVWPARNEAATIGTLVEAVDHQLRDACPLVDELIVIDSGSTDNTAGVAESAGASVFSQAAVLPHTGDVPGKGEAMWKSLAVATGDVVVFCDADLQEFDPQLLVGLLGPLLTDPTVSFVKASYDRALNTGERILPAGGGRVTELVARPLLNRYFPHLAGFVQPLAGEYAGRADLLRSIPFASGYAVDSVMLIDILHRVGLAGMAQVDGGRRQHRHATDASLGVMSGQILDAIMRRVAGEPAGISDDLTQFTRIDGEFTPTISSVATGERPPIANHLA